MQFVYLLMHEWEEYQQQTHVWMLISNTSPTILVLYVWKFLSKIVNVP